MPEAILDLEGLPGSVLYVWAYLEGGGGGNERLKGFLYLSLYVSSYCQWTVGWANLEHGCTQTRWLGAVGAVGGTLGCCAVAQSGLSSPRKNPAMKRLGDIEVSFLSHYSGRPTILIGLPFDFRNF